MLSEPAAKLVGLITIEPVAGEPVAVPNPPRDSTLAEFLLQLAGGEQERLAISAEPPQSADEAPPAVRPQSRRFDPSLACGSLDRRELSADLERLTAELERAVAQARRKIALAAEE